jgi:L-alanine-DL-glutamate epimerase-like enolase superfamily enzyme
MKVQDHRSVFKVTINAVILVGLTQLSIGCTAVRDNVLATTVTVIGVQIHQKDQDKTPELKIGYARTEFAFVPTDHETARNSTDQGTKGSASGSARNSAEVLMEIHAEGNFGLGTAYQGGVYQRLAVGQTAVQQPGAALMMAKNKDGTLDKNSADAVSKALQKIPQTPPDVLAAIQPLSMAYSDLYATKKDTFDKAVQAVQPDYKDFRSFISGDPNTPDLEAVKKVRTELEKDPEIKSKLSEIDEKLKPKQTKEEPKQK